MFGLYQQIGIVRRFQRHDLDTHGVCFRSDRADLVRQWHSRDDWRASSSLFSSAPRLSAAVTTKHNAGLLDAWDNMIHNNYPTYEAGINVTLPIRNRAAQAANAQAALAQRQQEVQYRQTQNTIVLNVRQALIALVQGRAAVAAAETGGNARATNFRRRAEEVSARLIHEL